jgi:hypothetical protein
MKGSSMQRYDGDASDTPDRYTLDAARFWPSTVVAAVVAAAVAVLVTDRLANVPVLAPRGHEGWGTTYAMGAASVTILAGMLMHLLIAKVAEPRRFFAWIMALATSIAMIIPLTLEGELSSKIDTTLAILTIGAVATGIVHGIAVATCRPRTPATRRETVAAARQWTVPPVAAARQWTVPPTYYRAERRLKW